MAANFDEWCASKGLTPSKCDDANTEREAQALAYDANPTPLYTRPAARNLDMGLLKLANEQLNTRLASAEAHIERLEAAASQKQC